MIKAFREFKRIINSKHDSYLSVDFEFYKKWKYIIYFLVKYNKNYINCKIFRKEYKDDRNLAIIGLKWHGKNVNNRRNGYARQCISNVEDPRCIYCSGKLDDLNVTIDHIVPISLGGTNAQVNLIPCCKKCNNERGNGDFEKFLRNRNKEFRKIKYPFI